MEKTPTNTAQHQPTQAGPEADTEVPSGVLEYINQILFSPTDKDTPPDKKTIWNYIKHCKKDSIGIGTLPVNISGELLTEPTRKGELLNDQFQSVFTRNTPLMINHRCQQATRLLPARVTV